MSTNEWYYFNDATKEQMGPITKKKLAKLYRKKVINKHSLIWNPSIHETWIPLSQDSKLLKNFRRKKRRTAPGIPEALLKQVNEERQQQSTTTNEQEVSQLVRALSKHLLIKSNALDKNTTISNLIANATSTSTSTPTPTPNTDISKSSSSPSMTNTAARHASLRHQSSKSSLIKIQKAASTSRLPPTAPAHPLRNFPSQKKVVVTKASLSNVRPSLPKRNNFTVKKKLTTTATTTTTTTKQVPKKQNTTSSKSELLQTGPPSLPKRNFTTKTATSLTTTTPPKINQITMTATEAATAWEEIADVLEQVLTKDLEDDLHFDLLFHTLTKTKGIEHQTPTNWHTELYDTAIKAMNEWRIYRLEPQLDFAFINMERSELIDVDKECQKYNYTSNEDIRIEELDILIHLSDENLLKKQYQHAKENGHTSRAIDREIKLKESQLVFHGKTFKWQENTNLRSSDEYADAPLICLNRQNLSDGMLYFNSNPIPTSLTYLNNDKNLIKTSINMFKSIQCYMGDRKLTTIKEQLKERVTGRGKGRGGTGSGGTKEDEASNIITLCTSIPVLKIELFSQIMKQLTRNPTQTSRSRGLDLLGICLSHFGPPSHLESYLQMFVRRHCPNPLLYIGSIYERVYRGDKREAPPSHEIVNVLNAFKQGKQGEEYGRHCPDFK